MVRNTRPRRRTSRGDGGGAGLLAVALTVAVVLAGACGTPRIERPEVPIAPEAGPIPALPEGPHLRILVLGDFGTGGPGQHQIAEAIARTHSEPENRPELVITVGDNFYYNGVDGLDDPLFERVFEDVYTGPFWDDLPFYPTLGNHDHRGDVGALIEYSEINPVWNFPDRYYSITRGIPGGGRVHLVAVDSEPLNRSFRVVESQLAFVDSVLGQVEAEWTLTYAHHPFLSEGPHGDQATLWNRLYPLIRGRVDAHVAGHSHTVELLPVDREMLQVVCGGGAGRDNDYDELEVTGRAYAAFTHGGWCLLRFWPETMAVELYDGEGELRYRHLVGEVGDSTVAPDSTAQDSARRDRRPPSGAPASGPA